MKYQKNSLKSRRSFLQVAGTGVGLNLITSIKSRADEKNRIIGSDEHTYECEHFWGEIPDGHSYGNASHGVAIDASGMIYVTHMGKPDSVFVFDPEGKFVKSMLPAHNKNGNRASGHGIDIRREKDGKEYLYLSPADAGLSFTKATMEGEVVWSRGKAELEKDSGLKLDRYRPTNASFGPEGDVYLGDGYGSGYIFQYSANGDFVGVFGGTGTEDGKFKTPHGQWLDDRDGISKTAVCDRANARLQWFDMENQHLKTMDGFLFPADLDTKDDLMVVPDLHARITLLGKNDEIIAHLADDESWRRRVLDKREKMRASPDKWVDGKFIHPHDAAFDRDGNIFVAEWVIGGRVTKLRKVS